MSTLLLAGPYGWECATGIWIRLNYRGTSLDANALREVLAGYSCYPPAIERIILLLNQVGQYSCVLMYSWFANQHRQCVADLHALGVELTITRVVYAGMDEPDNMLMKLYGTTSTSTFP